MPKIGQSASVTVAVVVALTALATGTSSQGWATGDARPASLHASRSPRDRPLRFFSPSSFWNVPVTARAPLDPSSARLVGALDGELARSDDTLLRIQTTTYSVPIYTVGRDAPTVRVQLRADQPALSNAWSHVPLPADAKPAAGTDAELVVWQPSSNRMWEFWQLVHGADGWSASWGGAIEHVSSDPGVYGPSAWPGATQWWGATASSLALAGGLITLEDLADGHINHALAISLPNVRADNYAAPAQRTDGTSASPLSLPEGAHLRLNPSLRLASLHLPQLMLMLAQAAQRYGIYIRDDSPNVGFYCQDPTPTGVNPYSGPHGYFEGKTPEQLLAGFPWRELELLKMSLHSLPG